MLSEPPHLGEARRTVTFCGGAGSFPRMWSHRFLLTLGMLLSFVSLALAQGPTRAEVLAVAKSYAEYQWTPTEQNFLQGKDADGVEVKTPANPAAGGSLDFWTANQLCTGVPYKWGGFDTLASFEKGVKAGKAAGDLYTAEKRRLGDKAVSHQAVGVDCSGFISRCWKLPQKFGTSTLPRLCRPLDPAELKPGDIMNTVAGHVLLFAAWQDEAHTTALFYEAEPFSKVRASEFAIADLSAAGFKAWRYRRMRD